MPGCRPLSHLESDRKAVMIQLRPYLQLGSSRVTLELSLEGRHNKGGTAEVNLFRPCTG